jgi:Zn finger protein HypA/HybF involved in hydrogenase expression
MHRVALGKLAYEENPKMCKQCGIKLPYEKRRHTFCSHTCAGNFNRKGVFRPHAHSDVCANCGGVKERRSNKYCNACIEKRIFNRRTSLEESRDDRSRKRIIVEERGWKCAVCGLSEWMGKPIPLDLDHVDGNADNNTLENLRLICPNCHAQTETYKGANAGKGSSRQKMRRQRYADGKTY